MFAETQPAGPALEPVFAAEGPALPFTSTNPVIQLGGSLFDQIRGPVVQPAFGPNTLIPFKSN